MSATRASLTPTFEYLCKMDLDLVLPPGYFEGLVRRMEAEPRLGSTSGKPWFVHPRTGGLVPEVCGDEMSVGMTKFYRHSCFNEIGGFVPQVMWDGIDCHRARMLGWMAESVNDESLRFVHLRPQGASQHEHLDGPAQGRFRPVLHGHRAALLPRERGLPRLRAPGPRRQRRDALGLHRGAR